MKKEIEIERKEKWKRERREERNAPKRKKTLQRNIKIWLNRRRDVNRTMVKKRKKKTEGKKGKPRIGK